VVGVEDSNDGFYYANVSARPAGAGADDLPMAVRSACGPFASAGVDAGLPVAFQGLATSCPYHGSPHGPFDVKPASFPNLALKFGLFEDAPDATVDAGDEADASQPDSGTSTEPDSGTSTEPDSGTSTEPDSGAGTLPDGGGLGGNDAGGGNDTDGGVAELDAGAIGTTDAGATLVDGGVGKIGGGGCNTTSSSSSGLSTFSLMAFALWLTRWRRDKQKPARR
jgi:hypothetical protein